MQFQTEGAEPDAVQAVLYYLKGGLFLCHEQNGGAFCQGVCNERGNGLRFSRSGRSVNDHVAAFSHTLYHARLRVVATLDKITGRRADRPLRTLGGALFRRARCEQLVYGVVGQLFLFKKGVVVVDGVGKGKSCNDGRVTDGKTVLFVRLAELVVVEQIFGGGKIDMNMSVPRYDSTDLTVGKVDKSSNSSSS